MHYVIQYRCTLIILSVQSLEMHIEAGQLLRVIGRLEAVSFQFGVKGSLGGRLVNMRRYRVPYGGTSNLMNASHRQVPGTTYIPAGADRTERGSAFSNATECNYGRMASDLHVLCKRRVPGRSGYVPELEASVQNKE